MTGFDVVFINGTVGAGKSTLAEAIGELEVRAGLPHALIDLDHIRQCWPSPADDPFNHALELRNLRDLAANYRRAGARHLIVAGVIEQRSAVARYQAALGSTAILLVRLVVEPAIARDRIRRRHADDETGLRWHLDRTTELAGIIDAAGLDDLVLDSSHEPPAVLAEKVRTAAGW
ncbi:AAA family ATPase [Saccharopolyspora sp. 5N102]|uniref:AAA family ATPase n=1 Tax=Saccharopolyspora sp. 5N102 TaxID=3375155 RepID=UPI0037B361F3